VKQQIAAWAGHAGRELLVWFGFARNASRWAIERLRAFTLHDLATLAWVGVFIAIAILVVEDLSRDIVSIEPISTPKAFAEGGYTSEVASRRLHDALNSYAENADSFMQMSVAQSVDLPDFVVPKLDLSLNAIVNSIRGALHYRDSQRITGEFTQEGKLSLRVRVDGHEVFSGSSDSNDPDGLLAAAAPHVMDKIRPYLVASTMYASDPARAIEKADEIIARAGNSNVNTQWSYILKGKAMADQGKLDQAEIFDRAAVALGWNNWVAHSNLGSTLHARDKLDEAIAQFKRAIAIEPLAALAYTNLAGALRDKAGSDGKLDEAAAQCRHALAINPRYSLAHLEMGRIFEKMGKADEALGEYRAAIKFASSKDPDLDTYYFALGLALGSKEGDAGRLNDAIAAYERTIAINPGHSGAHNNLGLIWLRQGKPDDAIREFNKAIAADPANGIIRDNLELARKQKESVARK